MPSPAALAAALGRFLRNPQFALLALGLGVGALAGFGAVGFREAIALVQWGALGFASERVFTLAAEQPWWRVLLAPAAGGLAVGLLIRFTLPGERPQGVADVMEAAALRAGRMSSRTGLAAALASATAIGTGASVGREGPVVHFGAALASWVARRLRLSRPMMVTMLGCGVASAIAASFNAPIAGVFFALEVVVGTYALSSFAPVVIAAVVGTVIARLWHGDYPAFAIPDHAIASFLEFPAFALLGVVSAAVAVLFMRATFAVEDAWNRVPAFPRWLRPAAAGLVLGAVAVWYPHVLGVGYETTDAALAEAFALGTLFVLLVLKLAVTVLCLGSGFAGGVFSPSVVLGALAGGAFGVLATGVFPDLSSGSGVYAVVGMGAVAGAVLGAPISTILIVFELTSSFSLTIAVMIGVVVASVITQQVAGRSFFTLQLSRRGLSLAGGREVNLLRARAVAEILRTDHAAVPADLSMPEVRTRLRDHPAGLLFVVAADGSGRLAGTLTLHDLADAAFDTSHDRLLRAADVARPGTPTLARDADLEAARDVLESSGEDHIAVVDAADGGRLVGYVRAQDVTAAYNAALLQARREERGEA